MSPAPAPSHSAGLSLAPPVLAPKGPSGPPYLKRCPLAVPTHSLSQPMFLSQALGTHKCSLTVFLHQRILPEDRGHLCVVTMYPGPGDSAWHRVDALLLVELNKFADRQFVQRSREGSVSKPGVVEAWQRGLFSLDQALWLTHPHDFPHPDRVAAAPIFWVLSMARLGV